jgi:hypothetical protein
MSISYDRLDATLAAIESGQTAEADPACLEKVRGMIEVSVALVVGGSIVIPHLRHAFETIDLLRTECREP